MNDALNKLFSNFFNKASATDEDALRACHTLGFSPPPDYLDAMAYSDGGEGFIGHSYFRLYSVEQLLSLNQAYQVSSFAPGLVVFGSDGGGEAFGFDIRQKPLEIVQIPFIPMDFQYAEALGRSFLEFLHALEGVADGDGPPKINREAIGKEVHDIQPIVFGGSPTDRKNKALVTLEEHAELCVFWNRIYYRKLHEKESSQAIRTGDSQGGRQ